MKSKTERSKRYYLHSKLKGVCRFNAAKHTLYCPTNELEIVMANKHVQKLVREYDYSIQTEIPKN